MKLPLCLLFATGLTAVTGAEAPKTKPEVRAGAPVETSPLPALPSLQPLFDYPIRDTSICTFTFAR